jgi:hypothetical protein
MLRDKLFKLLFREEYEQLIAIQEEYDDLWLELAQLKAKLPKLNKTRRVKK